jgi:CHAT domain-containing protein/tetratricopeptide (TPR) repeat protein
MSVGGDGGLDEILQQLSRLETAGAVRDLLAGRPELERVSLLERLSDRVVTLVHTDLARAERIADAVDWLADRLGDDYSRGRSLRTRAHILFSRGDHSEATARYDEALRCFRSTGDLREVGRTLSSSLQPLIYLGRYEEALARAEEARGIFQASGDRLRIARLDSNLGNLHYRRDRLDEALALYQRACAAFREHGDPHDVAVALRNTAVCLISLGRFPDALETYREAREHCLHHGLSLLVVEADYNIAYLYFLRGRYTRAMELYRTTREGCERLGDRYHQALCDLDEAEMYVELDLVGEAVPLAERAYAGFRDLEMGYEAAKALTFLALAACAEGKAFRALELLEQARERFARERNSTWPALVDVYRAVVLHREGRHFEARQLCETALPAFVERGVPARAALCEVVLARTHLDSGAPGLARQACRSALERLAGARSPALVHQASFLLGRAEEALGDLAAAEASYRNALAALEDPRSRLGRDDLKLGFLRDKSGVFESLVWLRVGGGRRPEDLGAAFVLVEQAKSRALAELVAFRGAPGLPPHRGHSHLVERIHHLREELNWYYRRIDLSEVGRHARDPGAVERLRGETRQVERELLRTLGEVEDRDLALLQRGGVAGIDEIRASLPRDGLLLEYYQARGTVVATVLGAETLEVLPLTPWSRVRHLLELLYIQLSRFRLGDDHARAFSAELDQACRARLQELYSELVAPIRSRLEASRLVVVPHGVLHNLPFHALHDGRRHLIEDFSISYAPSASLYRLLRERPPSAGMASLVMGIPDPRRPGIVDEVEAAVAALPSARLFIGTEATEQRLRELGASSRYVHLATTGEFRFDSPMFSSLALGASRLGLFDLFGLDLPADLVALSGCGTALDRVEGGDERLGLLRGLYYAGARAVLVTLWDAHDRSAADFLSSFYRRLGCEPDTAAAARAAMLDVRERRPHPFHWAPFLLTGNVFPG